MTSIVAHKVLQALLMLATSDICPDADWYGEPTDYSGQYVVIDQCFVKSYHSELEVASCAKRHTKKVGCAVPLTPGMSKTDARAFWRLAHKLSGRIDQRR